MIVPDSDLRMKSAIFPTWIGLSDHRISRDSNTKTLCESRCERRSGLQEEYFDVIPEWMGIELKD